MTLLVLRREEIGFKPFSAWGCLCKFSPFSSAATFQEILPRTISVSVKESYYTRPVSHVYLMQPSTISQGSSVILPVRILIIGVIVKANIFLAPSWFLEPL